MSRPKQYNYDVGLTIRMTSKMHNKIAKLAKLEMRFLNTEILFAIDKYISDYEKKNGEIV